jgi:hypothetical protein
MTKSDELGFVYGSQSGPSTSFTRSGLSISSPTPAILRSEMGYSEKRCQLNPPPTDKHQGNPRRSFFRLGG